MISQTLPAYLYQQYSYDDTTQYLQAFFDAYNQQSQANLDQLNNINLPIYTNSNIQGILLDWVGQGIYGFARPTLPAGYTESALGVYNTEPYDTTAYSENITSVPSTFYTVTDDYYKRMLTWNFYKGDGFQYSTQWLKRRIKRFLYGANGISPDIDNTYEISVTYPTYKTVSIDIPNLTISPIFKAAIQAGVLYVPFEYAYTVTY